MADDNSSLQGRLVELKKLRNELETIKKEAFMAAPPMPGGGGAPPMDPSMMQGGMPPGGAPPMDPSMMQGGMPPGGGGMPPVDPNTGMPIDPATGMPIDPNTGMPMDPAMMQGGMPPGGDPAAGGGGPITPEMLDELLGVIEEMAARQESQDQAIAQFQQAVDECMGKCEELEQRLAEVAAQPAEPAAPMGYAMG